MQVDQIPQLMQLNSLQNQANSNSGDLSSADSFFSTMFENLIQNVADGQTTSTDNTVNKNDSTQNTETNGIDNLSMKAQSLQDMLQLQALQSMSATGDNIGSVDDSSDDSNDNSNDSSNLGYSDILQSMGQDSSTTNQSGSILDNFI